MATQITADLPTLDFPKEVDYPTQKDWAAFSAAAELNFGILGSSWSTQMQLWKTQANAMSTELNTNADLAQSIANYQGDWTSKGYTLGQTVSVSGVYYICKLTHATGQNPTAVGSLYWNLALGNWNLKVNTDMSGYISKTTPVDADLIPLSDSAASFEIKKLSWANLKASLKIYFDTLYMALTGDQTITGIKSFTNNLLVTGSAGAIGYGAGSGGTVTQLTSKNTAVTLNKRNGRIIMSNGNIASNGKVVFILNNSLLTSADHIYVTLSSGYINTLTYKAYIDSYTNNVAYIILENISNTTLGEGVILDFLIFKGSNS